MKSNLAALVPLVFVAACSEREKTPRPEFGRTPPVVAEPLPAPEPPPEGAWAMTVGTAEDGCAVGAPPEVVYVAGNGQDWQIALQPFFLDAAGVLRGDSLELNGAALSVRRPTTDCVIAERDTWTLTRTAPETLDGELVRVREASAGLECAQTLPEGVELPCLSRWTVRLDHRSAKRAPKIEP